MQKGYYHRNVNFQTYVDVPHAAFTSGQHATVDPPHLRMVFDAAVVNSLLQPAQQPLASSAQAAGSAVTHEPTSQVSERLVQSSDGSPAEIQEPGTAAVTHKRTAAVTHKQTSPPSVGLVQSSDGSPAQIHAEENSSSATSTSQATIGSADGTAGACAQTQTTSISAPYNATDMADASQASGGPQSQSQDLPAEKFPRQRTGRLAQAGHSQAECQQDRLAAQSNADRSDACCSSSAHDEAQPKGSAGAAKTELEAEPSSQPSEEAVRWDSVLKHSMKLARNIKWTHKGLQVSR